LVRYVSALVNMTTPNSENINYVYKVKVALRWTYCQMFLLVLHYTMKQVTNDHA